MSSLYRLERRASPQFHGWSGEILWDLDKTPPRTVDWLLPSQLLESWQSCPLSVWFVSLIMCRRYQILSKLLEKMKSPEESYWKWGEEEHYEHIIYLYTIPWRLETRDQCSVYTEQDSTLTLRKYYLIILYLGWDVHIFLKNTIF